MYAYLSSHFSGRQCFKTKANNLNTVTKYFLFLFYGIYYSLKSKKFQIILFFFVIILNIIIESILIFQREFTSKIKIGISSGITDAFTYPTSRVFWIGLRNCNQKFS